MRNIVVWFHNLKFKQKLSISFIIIGILPFLLLSVLFLVKTDDSIKAEQEFNLSTQLKTIINSITNEREKIEKALNILVYDQTISDVLTGEYKSEYDKYYKVTVYYDSVVDTIKKTNDAIKTMCFYVTNSLSEVRINFLPISKLDDEELFQKMRKDVMLQWFYSDGNFVVYERIPNVYDITQYAVVKTVIDYNYIVNSDIVKNNYYSLTLNGVTVHSPSETELDMLEKYDSVDIFNGNGSFTLYRKKTSIFTDNTDLITLIVMFFLAFGSLIFAIVMLSHSLVKRLDYVKDKMQSIVETNFQTTLEEDYDDEIGQLKKILNKVIFDIKRLIEDVYQSVINQKEAEFKALQAQINPHFLYNALSAVNWKAIKEGNKDISSIVIMLSKFYRTALNKGERITTIKNEIENITAYINIQLYVHSESFDVKYEFDESVYDCKMPNLIIQPLVENAIEHGINYVEGERGYLKVAVYNLEEHIKIEITNNGPKVNINEDVFEKESHGYGLFNVNKRLQLCFGENYKLYFECDDMTKTIVTFPHM